MVRASAFLRVARPPMTTAYHISFPHMSVLAVDGFFLSFGSTASAHRKGLVVEWGDLTARLLFSVSYSRQVTRNPFHSYILWTG